MYNNRNDGGLQKIKNNKTVCAYTFYVWKSVNTATKAAQLIHLPLNGVKHKNIYIYSSKPYKQ